MKIFAPKWTNMNVRVSLKTGAQISQNGCKFKCVFFRNPTKIHLGYALKINAHEVYILHLFAISIWSCFSVYFFGHARQKS